jgi:hypothetical protein
MATRADAALQGLYRDPAAPAGSGNWRCRIAGNHDILITVIAPDAAKLDIKGTTELFSLELDGRPGFRRAGLMAADRSSGGHQP